MAARTALIAIAGLAANAPVSHAQPIHDTCNNALPISPCGGVYTGSTVGATQSGSSSCSPSATRDVWHSVTIANTGYLDVFTCPASFDTVISLHTACPSPQSSERDCNDNSAYCGTAYPNTSYFHTWVSPGTYLIRVAGANASMGTYTLNTNFTPINDACTDAIPIAEGTGQRRHDLRNHRRLRRLRRPGARPRHLVPLHPKLQRLTRPLHLPRFLRHRPVRALGLPGHDQQPARL
jgi:hypothetical protein